MDKEFKVIVDEQSKQSLNRLKSCFEELLKPLEKLETLTNHLDSLEDSLGTGNREIKGKISEIIDVVENIKKKSCEIYECQEDMSAKVDFLKRELTDFKEGLKAVEWNWRSEMSIPENRSAASLTTIFKDHIVAPIKKRLNIFFGKNNSL